MRGTSQNSNCKKMRGTEGVHISWSRHLIHATSIIYININWSYHFIHFFHKITLFLNFRATFRTYIIQWDGRGSTYGLSGQEGGVGIDYHNLKH